MKILSIDPAASKPNAYAIIDNDRVTEYGTFKTYEEFQVILLNRDISAVAIEDQYSGVNTKSYKMLVKVAAVLEYIAETLGFRVYIVPPKSWMSSIDIPVHARRGQERDRWIITLSKSLIPRDGFFKLSIDEACAIQIGYYIARRMKSAKLQGAS